jgi:hypothetical protein
LSFLTNFQLKTLALQMNNLITMDLTLSLWLLNTMCFTAA